VSKGVGSTYEAVEVEAPLAANLGGDISGVAEEIPQLGRGAGTAWEAASRANDGNGLVEGLRHGGDDDDN
jgi:hypothetical protein